MLLVSRIVCLSDAGSIKTVYHAAIEAEVPLDSASTDIFLNRIISSSNFFTMITGFAVFPRFYASSISYVISVKSSLELIEISPAPDIST